MEYLEKEEIKITKLKEVHVKKYNLFLSELGYSNHTIARKNSSLRVYLKYLRKEGIMVHNPMDDIKQPALTSRKPKIDHEKIKEMIKLIPDERKRDRLLLSLCYYEKIKISDAIELKWYNYKKDEGVLYTGKKAIILTEETKWLLDRSLDGSMEEKETNLLTSQHQKPLTNSGAYYIVKRYLKEWNQENIRPIDLWK